MFNLQGNAGTWLLIFVPMITTAVVTALFCYSRVARKRRISFGFAVLAACLVPFLTLFVTNLVHHGLKVFTLSFWARDASLMVVLVLLGFAAVLCLIPAAGVCAWFKAKQRSEAGEKKSV